MRILFTLDDVLRGKTKQMIKIYKKYVKPELDENSVEITEEGLRHDLPFKTDKDYQRFLYVDYAFEIFSEATPPTKGVDKDFIMWHMHLNDEKEEGEENDEVIIGNPFEFNNSIGFTYFYLSKIATRVREVYLPLNSSELWDKCDVMVTASTALLNSKPEGKKSVKIEMPYNKDCNSDLVYEDLKALLNDEEFIKKLKV